MVLGSIIYETIDIIYNVSRIGKNTLYGLYNWYYLSNNENNENNKNNENNTIILLENRIKILENKIKLS